MKKIYLFDTSVIVAHPELLANRSGANVMAIPRAVLNEITARKMMGRTSQLDDVLETSLRNGVQVVDTPDVLLENVPKSREFSRLDGADIDILKIMVDANASDNENIWTVITKDRYLILVLQSLGMKAFLPEEFAKEEKNAQTHNLSEGKGGLNFEQENASIQRKAEEYIGEEKKYERSNIAIGASSVIVLYFLVYFFNNLFLLFKSYFSPWLLVPLVAIVGLALFWFRQKYRWPYGILEVCVGVYAAALPLFNINYSSGVQLNEGYQILAGLYIIVRGLDNIGNGIKGTRYEPYWKSKFG